MKLLQRFLRYSNFLKPFRSFIGFFINLFFYIYWPSQRKPRVMSHLETLDIIQNTTDSLVRYGDGEILYMLDKVDLPFKNRKRFFVMCYLKFYRVHRGVS